MDGSLDDLQKILEEVAKELPDKALRIMEVESLNFIHKNFQDQGYTDTGFSKWQERKTTDRKGRDLTRYRTNRVGRAGDLTKFGRENQGRAILTGHNTGGDKLRNSWRARREKLSVVLYTYKDYAEYHNEGTDHLPKRQFIGKSAYLDTKIEDKIKRTLDKLFTK